MFETLLKNFLKELKEYNIIAYITGGQAFKKYFNSEENTTDYDIHIYLTYKQLTNKETFNIIYNLIKNLHVNLKKIIKINRLNKFDYANYSKKYIDYNLLNKSIEFYNSNVICDIQIEDYDNTYVDISVSYSPSIEMEKNKINDDFYIKKDSLLKELNNYHDDLVRTNYNKKKIEKIKNRIKYINKSI